MVQKLLLRSSGKFIQPCILSFAGYVHLNESSLTSARITFTSLIFIMIYIVWFHFLFMISLKSKTKYIKLTSCKKKKIPTM